MSGLVNKVKDAISGDKHNTNTSTTGLENEHGTQSGVHDTPIDGSVAHGSSVSNTNPGILHSTQRGIHGDRDPGIGETAGSGYGDTTTTRNTGLGGDSGLKSGPQFTGTGDRDAGLVQSGLDSTGREGGRGLTGSGYDDTRDTGLTGTGSGYDNTRDVSGGSGTGYDSGVTGGSGTGYDESTRGTGLTGSGYDAGTTGNTSTGTSLVGKAERYMEGSEKHHRGDGHPEDIVHPGPHETRTAKALDPHLNQ